MALQPCPECQQKISQRALTCPHCGFALNEANEQHYRQLLAERRLHNDTINRQSMKVHLVWLAIFVGVIVVASLIKG
ncbi:hypothetical protein A4G19_04965 [Pasteurellaceae bacterium Macca]|nr:hypothetical protein [Pasteurellaceae bacterium Macca]